MYQANGFNRALALFASFATIVHESDANIAAGITGASATASSTIAASGATFVVGDRIIRSAGSGDWTGIAINVPLFVVAAVAGTSFGVSLTEGGTAISTTGTAGVFNKCEVFYAEPLNNESQAPKYAQIFRRGMTGLRGLAAQQISENIGEWSWEVDEDLRTLTLFGGCDVGQSDGFNTIYVRDASDIASKIRKQSERFRGAITSSRNSNIGGGEFSKPQLKITATKPDGSQVAWSTNTTAAV